MSTLMSVYGTGLVIGLNQGDGPNLPLQKKFWVCVKNTKAISVPTPTYPIITHPYKTGTAIAIMQESYHIFLAQ